MNVNKNFTILGTLVIIFNLKLLDSGDAELDVCMMQNFSILILFHIEAIYVNFIEIFLEIMSFEC